MPEEIRYTDSLEKFEIILESGNLVVDHVAFVKITSQC